MNDYQRSYYHKMKRRERLIPIIKDNKVAGLLTFFIGNGDVSKYVRADSWSIVDDDINGDTCYIDHLVTDGKRQNPYKSIAVWRFIKSYIKQRFPSVVRIRWNRFRENKVKTYIKRI